LQNVPVFFLWMVSSCMEALDVPERHLLLVLASRRPPLEPLLHAMETPPFPSFSGSLSLPLSCFSQRGLSSPPWMPPSATGSALPQAPPMIPRAPPRRPLSSSQRNRSPAPRVADAVAVFLVGPKLRRRQIAHRWTSSDQSDLPGIPRVSIRSERTLSPSSFRAVAPASTSPARGRRR
jgi:hypothetical protein